MNVALFAPCFVDMFFPQTARSVVRLLTSLGIDVKFPTEQTCCGQPQFNAGHREHAARLARRFCQVFAPFDLIVSPSGSCTAMVRVNYPELIGDNPVIHRVVELSELLIDHLGITDVGAHLPGTAAVHVGCHARRKLGITPKVLRLLEHVDGLTVVPTKSDTWCCGFGGTFSVKLPEVSVAMGERKLRHVLERDVDFLISTDPSCSMHMQGILDRRASTNLKILQLADVLCTGVSS